MPRLGPRHTEELEQSLATDLRVSTSSLNPDQRLAWELLRGSQRHTLLYGGSRGGKSVVIVKAIVTRALHAPGSRHALMRFRQNAVWPSLGMDTFPAVMARFFPGVPYSSNDSYHYFTVKGGSEIWLGGLDEGAAALGGKAARSEKILGREYATIFFNEISQIPYTSVVMALTRLAQKVDGLTQRAYYDLNPVGKGHWSYLLFHKHLDPVTKQAIPDPDEYQSMLVRTISNQGNLDAAYVRSLEALPPRQRQRFLAGEYQDDTEEALWTIEGLEALRVKPDRLPDMRRIVVAVDPSGAADALDFKHDEIGIMVCGLGVDGHGYVLEDSSCLDGPEGWGRKAVSAFYRHHADAIVAEINFGGAMVKHVIRSVDEGVPFREVNASRGKVVRAEPVSVLASLDERSGRRLHHVGRLSELEDELCQFTTMGYIGQRSPNRADAYVWGFTDLMLGPSAKGWVDYYASMAQDFKRGGPQALVQAPPTKEELEAKPEDMRAPQPWQNFAFGGGIRYQSDADRLIRNVQPEHVAALQKFGCIRLSDEGI